MAGGINPKAGASITASPSKVPTGAGSQFSPVVCAVKVGGHSLAFLAQAFVIHDASPLQPARIKPFCLGRNQAGGEGQPLSTALAAKSLSPVHEDISA